jgi:RNA polymerase sigma-70 factor, ECF subfamily
MAGEDAVEAKIHSAHDAGDFASAATLVIEHYGGEILAFLNARLRDAAQGEEVFGVFAEKLWTGLPGFAWRCSVKGWAYRLARNAANDFVAAPHARKQRNLALSAHAMSSQLMDQVRNTTARYLKTPVKDRVRALRETLPLDDQMLLILRVDRGMSFRDLAGAMASASGTDADALDFDLDKEAARLRKRFERVKDELRELAKAEGLLKDD